jgi:hypothetical protein
VASGELRLAGLDENADGEKVCLPTGTQPARNERPVYGAGPLEPVVSVNTAVIKKITCCALGEAKAGQTGPVKQAPILKGRDQRETCLHARRFGVIRCGHGRATIVG